MGKYRDPEDLDLLGFKKCSKCGKWLPRDEFNKCKDNSDRLFSHCRRCNIEHVSKWQKEHPEAHRKKNARWRAANPEAYREANARWYAANPEYRREYHKQPMPAWKEKIRRETRQLILQGLILHPGGCEKCGVVAGEETIHVHHLSYLRPDLVLFLCPQCHQRWHNENQSPPEPTQEWVEMWYASYNDYPQEGGPSGNSD